VAIPYEREKVNYLIDVTILSMVNLMLGLFMFMATIFSGLVGNHH
jgi:hypothetical protein